MVVNLISMTLNFRLRIVVLPVILPSGSNNVNAQKATSVNFVNLALPDIDIVPQTVDLSCLASLVTVTNTLKFVTPKLEDVFANITRPVTIATNVQKASTEMPLLDPPMIANDVLAQITELVCSFLMNP